MSSIELLVLYIRCIYNEYVEYAYIFYILKLVFMYSLNRGGYRNGIFTGMQIRLWLLEFQSSGERKRRQNDYF